MGMPPPPGPSPMDQGSPPSDPSMMGQPPMADPSQSMNRPPQLTPGDPNAQPVIVPTHSYDNHAIHIEVHNKYRKSQQFEQLPDPAKAAFEAHVQQHMDALAMQMPMMGPGQPPGGPPPPDNGPPMPPGA